MSSEHPHGPDHDHSHDHGHSHEDDHHHDHAHDGEHSHLDATVSDRDLSPGGAARRHFLRTAGMMGGTVAAASVFGSPQAAAAAADRIAGGKSSVDPNHEDDAERADHDEKRMLWLAGDHHIHTQYSPDGQYKIIQQVGHASTFGLDWMVITDHGGADHARIGVDRTYPDVLAAREAYKRMLVFQGFEWNIPAAEHGTVFVAPFSKDGRTEMDVLKAFETSYDGSVNDWGASTPANEQHALDGLGWLVDQINVGNAPAALFLANHPARKGIDSPHEIRGWRAKAPGIAIGMEGAPGHQAAGIAKPFGPGSGRGYYDNSPSANSFAAYPPESYRTWGGFDWMTAVVGGLWDSLLAEGQGWWITANSDSHQVHNDTFVQNPPIVDGRYGDPIDSLKPQSDFGDFYPGYYSRTHVGSRSRSYMAVMDGMRDGRIWVSHGDLIRGLRVAVRAANDDKAATLGGRLVVKQGKKVSLHADIDLTAGINYNGDTPVLRRVDVIAGKITGPVSNLDIFSTPDTKVVKSFDISQTSGTVSLDYDFGKVDGPFYVRLRGHDGNVVGTATANDPTPPRIDPLGDANPWTDLWFYSNPVFVLPK
jgi:hypothetical protein